MTGGDLERVDHVDIVAVRTSDAKRLWPQQESVGTTGAIERLGQLWAHMPLGGGHGDEEILLCRALNHIVAVTLGQPLIMSTMLAMEAGAIGGVDHAGAAARAVEVANVCDGRIIGAG